MNKISIVHGYKSFGSQCILEDINIDLEKGNIYGLIGRNGSGKTVLLKCLIGFMQLSSGKILLDDAIEKPEGEFLQDVGFIVNQVGFLPELSGYKNLKYLASIKGTATKEDIRHSMQLVGLEPDSRKKVSHYSIGMKQKLGIAQAIMEKPSILILDEPMNGLDETSVDCIRHLLLELKKERKLIVISSHNREDVELLCDKTFKISNGRITVL
jgi:ABC-2 type transport system ATP-binding protein